MRWTGDAERGAWIGELLKGPLGSVASIVPSGFKAYARILHPVSVTRHNPKGENNPRDDYPTEEWSWARIAAHTGTIIHPKVQWIRVAGHQYSSLPLPGNRSAEPPPLGWLNPRLLAEIMRTATAHTSTTDDITAAVWTGWGFQSNTLARGPFLELPGRQYVLLATSTEELANPLWPWEAEIGWGEGFSGPMPQLIWPEDRAWAITSEIDFDSTLIGGSFEFINQVMEIPAVEAERVEPTTDLTWDADDVNRPTS